MEEELKNCRKTQAADKKDEDKKIQTFEDILNKLEDLSFDQLELMHEALHGVTLKKYTPYRRSLLETHQKTLEKLDKTEKTVSELEREIKKLKSERRQLVTYLDKLSKSALCTCHSSKRN
ncbi:hypothetical protein L9F63_005852 [Diploptera punctata]|uniref:Uncharacterized protein n=1 Tax=Diploptera punctata TaxID=6984 RepID=A0AAD8E521_DIPPU|nr:hypothetical protein L9F63_005852 [Diploptera punctata]